MMKRSKHIGTIQGLKTLIKTIDVNNHIVQTQDRRAQSVQGGKRPRKQSVLVTDMISKCGLEDRDVSVISSKYNERYKQRGKSSQ